MTKPILVTLLCAGLSSCTARQPSLPPPLEIGLNGALGFELGVPLDAAREAATRRGDQLMCRTQQELQLCTPLPIPGEPGYYTVAIAEGTVRSVSFQLRSWPDVTLPVIESELERIAILRAAGPMTDAGRGYMKIWTNAAWTREVISLCTDQTETACDIRVSAVEPHHVQARAARINARQSSSGSVPDGPVRLSGFPAEQIELEMSEYGVNGTTSCGFCRQDEGSWKVHRTIWNTAAPLPDL